MLTVSDGQEPGVGYVVRQCLDFLSLFASAWSVEEEQVYVGRAQ
jgi:hypothetical protein